MIKRQNQEGMARRHGPSAWEPTRTAKRSVLCKRGLESPGRGQDDTRLSLELDCISKHVLLQSESKRMESLSGRRGGDGFDGPFDSCQDK